MVFTFRNIRFKDSGACYFTGTLIYDNCYIMVDVTISNESYVVRLKQVNERSIFRMASINI